MQPDLPASLDLALLAEELRAVGWSCSVPNRPFHKGRVLIANHDRMPEALWIDGSGAVSFVLEDRPRYPITVLPELADALAVIRQHVAPRPTPKPLAPTPIRSEPTVMLPVEVARVAERCCRAIAASWDDHNALAAAQKLQEVLADERRGEPSR